MTSRNQGLSPNDREAEEREPGNEVEQCSELITPRKGF